MPTVLHAVVGHKLPTYFENAVQSVRTIAPDDDLLIVDNASDLPSLRAQFTYLDETDPHVTLLARERNDLSRNAKVGGLYDAYREVMEHALAGGYDLLHLIQGDMQLLWWDETVVTRAVEIFERHDACVNLHTTAIPRDRRLSDAVRTVDGRLLELCGFGLSDTGLYDLRRWRERGVRFHDSEREHASAYRRQGLRVLCHPWAPVAQVPWPAVVRNGEVRGREVSPRRPLLLRPLDAAEVAAVKSSPDPVWLEDVCTPWGWVCLTPMTATALESIEYWVYRYRDLRARGWRAARPSWERRGIDPRTSVWRAQRRPSLWQVALLPPWYGLKRLLASR